MQTDKTSRKIKIKKRGNALGFWFFKVSLRLFGLKGAYGLLYIVCLYYLFFDRLAVCAALAYINKRFPGSGFLKTRLHVYRLFISQGKQLIDRYVIVSGAKSFDIRLKEREQFISLIRNSERGLILLTAHVGNWQVAMTVLKETKKTVYLLMRPEDNPAVAQSLRISDAGKHIKIISPEQYLGGVVEVMSVLKEGSIVSMMGDRKYGFNALNVSFLEEKAEFPYGAFSIAAAAGCPLVVLLSAKLSAYRYDVDATRVMRPCYEKGKDKRQQLKAWVQEFVLMLEEYVKQYPYQCFLFHDVWNRH